MAKTLSSQCRGPRFQQLKEEIHLKKKASYSKIKGLFLKMYKQDNVEPPILALLGRNVALSTSASSAGPAHTASQGEAHRYKGPYHQLFPLMMQRCQNHPCVTKRDLISQYMNRLSLGEHDVIQRPEANSEMDAMSQGICNPRKPMGPSAGLNAPRWRLSSGEAALSPGSWRHH